VEIPSCPHNALLEILSRNHARVVPDGFLRDLPVSMPANGFLNHPESFMKIADALFKKNNILLYHRHFLPFRRADFTASTSFQGTRGEEPQLRNLCLASAATSTRE